MKYYRLKYSYEDELKEFIKTDLEDIQFLMKDVDMKDTPDNRMKIAKDTVTRRYAFFQEGVIYPEDETICGNARILSRMVELYPDDWEEVPFMFKLTKNNKINKHCNDGKDRSYKQYFLNDVNILQQKIPFNEQFEEGFNIRLSIYDEYILNGKMYQTRYDIDKKKERHVSYPLSKEKLKQFNIPKDFKIVCDSNYF
jgi:hypothetical protein